MACYGPIQSVMLWNHLSAMPLNAPTRKKQTPSNINSQTALLFSISFLFKEMKNILANFEPSQWAHLFAYLGGSVFILCVYFSPEEAYGILSSSVAIWLHQNRNGQNRLLEFLCVSRNYAGIFYSDVWNDWSQVSGFVLFQWNGKQVFLFFFFLGKMASMFGVGLATLRNHFICAISMNWNGMFGNNFLSNTDAFSLKCPTGKPKK